MLRPIREIRARIASIPDIFFPFDPEETFRGHEPALELWREAETVWPENSSWLSDTEALVPTYDTEAGQEGGMDNVPLLDDLFEIGADIDEDALVEALGGETGERIRQSVLATGLGRGVEALAWHVPFHAVGVQWGIYIPVSSIAFVAVQVLGKLGADLETRLRLGLRALHQHELFHFATEYMSSQWEAVVGQPCYKPARRLKDSDLGYNLLEEELANGHLLRSNRRRVAGGTPTLRRWVLQMPPGYREGGNRTRHSDFIAGCEELASRYISCISPYDTARLGAVNLYSLFPFTPSIDWRYCPVHLIHDGARLNLPPLPFDFFEKVANIEEPAKFRKMMSKLSPEIQRCWEAAKRKLAISTAFESLGFRRWDPKKAKGKAKKRPQYRGKKIYTVSLDGGFRVHMEMLSDGSGRALEVGPHQDMGHGK